MHRILSIEEIIIIVRRVTGKDVFHVDMDFFPDCEQYVSRRR